MKIVHVGCDGDIIANIMYHMGFLKVQGYELIKRLYAMSDCVRWRQATKSLVRDKYADLVHGCYMMEHLTYKDVVQFLKEVRRIKKGGGQFRLGLSNLRYYIACYYVNNDADQFMIKTYLCSPDQKSISEKLKYVVYGNDIDKYSYMYESNPVSKLPVRQLDLEYKCKTPVVFIFFNRPGTMVQVLEQIKRVKPNLLYFVADGPRNDDEKHKTEECRRIANEMVDWECQVVHVYSDKNLGCKNRVASGISYVFEREEKAIILEDDCVPNVSFFRFMDDMLERYKDRNEIYLVTGRNDIGRFDEKNYDYYFAHHGAAWGWGTWARSWKLYDISMSHWPEICDKNGGHIREWMGWKEWIYRKRVNGDTYEGKIDTWDFQMSFTIQYNRKICIVPSVNLVRNIGEGIDATHTVKLDKMVMIPSYEMQFPLKHPREIVVHNSFDKVYSKKICEKNFWTNFFMRIIKKIIKKITGKEYSRKEVLQFFNRTSRKDA